jgi:hypothetical protein
MDSRDDDSIRVSGQVETTLFEWEQITDMTCRWFSTSSAFWINTDYSFFSLASQGSLLKSSDSLVSVRSLDRDISTLGSADTEDRNIEQFFLSDKVNWTSEMGKIGIRIDGSAVCAHQDNWLIVIELLFENDLLGDSLSVEDPLMGVNRVPKAIQKSKNGILQNIT